MSRTDSGRGSPRAVIHRRILDVAASRPDASLEAIADEVAGGTADLVERVLDEYGDPAQGTETEGIHTAGSDTEVADTAGSDTEVADTAGSDTEVPDTAGSDTEVPDTAGSDTEANSTETSSAEADDSGTVSTDGADADGTAPGESDPGTTGTQEKTMKQNGNQATEAELDPSSLSAKQRETLRLVHDHPGWSQAEVAERLDVSRATVSRRLNDIPGFEWSDRESFTRQAFDEQRTGEQAAEGGPTDTPPESQEIDAVEPESDEGTGTTVTARNGGAVAVGGEATLERFESRLDRIEAEIAALDGDPEGLPADLAHKVVHASMKSDRITEDEELRLIAALLE